MWTPKRIVLLMGGICAFCTSYLGYARSHLGTIDGLPTLPAEFRRTDQGHIEPPPPRQSRVEQKLKQAFGHECQELKHPIKMELNSRSMVLAAGQAKFEANGTVSLAPVSVAIFGKEKNDGRFVEINTLRGDLAYLTFDRPVFSPQDMNGRKLVGAELIGNIDIINNRRTPERTDDLILHINHGPMYYDEAKHLIWTQDRVSVLDQQSTPKPMQVRGKGMEVELTTEAPAKPGAPARKQKSESISGVKRISLQHDVEMYLYVDSNRSGMPGGDREPAKRSGAAVKETAPKDPADDDKAQIVIKSGRFRYDFNKDHDLATFDVPEVDPLHPPTSPEDVTVHRHLPKLNTDDRLFCKHLELRMRRKESAPAPKPGQPAAADRSPDQGVEIELARATGGPKEVLLVSDKLRAEGNEFSHDTRQGLTILRGDPEMEADSDGSIIHAREMQIQEEKLPGDVKGPNGKPRTYQRITAKGPGRVDMFDKKKDRALDHATWTDTLSSTRDLDTKGWTSDGPLDLLVLTGSARFWNEEQGTSLQGDTLKVWVMPREPEGDPAAKSQPAGQAGPRPRRVDSIGNVLFRSRDLVIHDTSRFKVIFKEAPATALPATVPAPAAPPTGPATPDGPVATHVTAPPVYESAKPTGADRRLPPGPEAPLPAGPALVPEVVPGAPRQAAAPGKPEEPARPLDLSARAVDATVLRGEVKNTLEKLWCEGRVHVRQDGDPAKPEDKGLDIKGSTLQMDWRPAGNLLTVAADDKAERPNENEPDLAQMLVNNLYIIGPEINVDQALNKVWVEGSGAMMMESATTLNGTKTAKPVPLTIHWNKSMLFTGKSAMFQGDIQAEQDNGRLACESLTVFFDRTISLKEGGNKGEKPAKVEHLVCDRKVLIEEATPEPDPRGEIDRDTGKVKERIAKYQKIRSVWVEMEVVEKEDATQKDTNKLHASGPGNVWLFQRGATDPLAPPDPAKIKSSPKPGDQDAMKLTYVEFGKTMHANNKTGKASFWGGVRVLNMPCEDLRIEVNLDEMVGQWPKDAMYLTSDRLEVVGQKTPQGKTYQEMTATSRVTVEANEFSARCDTLYFDEAKDQIIFRGNENGKATLTRRLIKGEQGKTISGKEIIYIRSTGAFKVDGGDFIGSN